MMKSNYVNSLLCICNKRKCCQDMLRNKKGRKNEEMEIQKNVFSLLNFPLVVPSLIVRGSTEQSRAEAQFRLIRAIYIENRKHL